MNQESKDRLQGLMRELHEKNREIHRTIEASSEPSKHDPALQSTRHHVSRAINASPAPLANHSHSILATTTANYPSNNNTTTNIIQARSPIFQRNFARSNESNNSVHLHASTSHSPQPAGMISNNMNSTAAAAAGINIVQQQSGNIRYNQSPNSRPPLSQQPHAMTQKLSTNTSPSRGNPATIIPSNQRYDQARMKSYQQSNQKQSNGSIGDRIGSAEPREVAAAQNGISHTFNIIRSSSSNSPQKVLPIRTEKMQNFFQQQQQQQQVQQNGSQQQDLIQQQLREQISMLEKKYSKKTNHVKELIVMVTQKEKEIKGLKQQQQQQSSSATAAANGQTQMVSPQKTKQKHEGQSGSPSVSAAAAAENKGRLTDERMFDYCLFLENQYRRLERKVKRKSKEIEMLRKEVKPAVFAKIHASIQSVKFEETEEDYKWMVQFYRDRNLPVPTNHKEQMQQQQQQHQQQQSLKPSKEMNLLSKSMRNETMHSQDFSEIRRQLRELEKKAIGNEQQNVMQHQQQLQGKSAANINTSNPTMNEAKKVISELEKRLKNTLEAQSKVTAAFDRKREECEFLENQLNAFVKSNGSSGFSENQLQQQLRDEIERLSELNARIVREKDNALAQCQEDYLRMEEEVARVAGGANAEGDLVLQLRDLQVQLADKEGEIYTALQENARLQEILQSGRVETQQQQSNKEQSFVSIEMLKSEVEEKNELISELERRGGKLKEELQEMNAKIEELLTKHDVMTDEIEELIRENQRLSEEVVHERSKYEKERVQSDGYLSEIGRLKEAALDAAAAEKNLTKECAKLNERLEKLNRESSRNKEEIEAERKAVIDDRGNEVQRFREEETRLVGKYEERIRELQGELEVQMQAKSYSEEVLLRIEREASLKDLRIETLNLELESAMQKYIQLASRQDEEEEEKVKRSSQLVQSRSNEDRMERTIGELRERVDALTTQLKEEQFSLKEVKFELSRSRETITELEEKIVQSKEKCRSFKSKLSEVEQTASRASITFTAKVLGLESELSRHASEYHKNLSEMEFALQQARFELEQSQDEVKSLAGELKLAKLEAQASNSVELLREEFRVITLKCSQQEFEITRLIGVENDCQEVILKLQENQLESNKRIEDSVEEILVKSKQLSQFEVAVNALREELADSKEAAEQIQAELKEELARAIDGRTAEVARLQGEYSTSLAVKNRQLEEIQVLLQETELALNVQQARNESELREYQQVIRNLEGELTKRDENHEELKRVQKEVIVKQDELRVLSDRLLEMQEIRIELEAKIDLIFDEKQKLVLDNQKYANEIEKLQAKYLLQGQTSENRVNGLVERVEELEVEVAEHQRSLDRLKTSKKEESIELTNKCDSLAAESIQKQATIDSLSTRFGHAQKQLSDFERELAEMRLKVAQSNEAAGEFAQEKERFEAFRVEKLSEVSALAIQLNERDLALENVKANARNEVAQISLQLEKALNEVSTKTSALSFAQNAILNASNSEKSFGAKLVELQEVIEAKQHAIDGLREEALLVEQEHENLVRSLQAKHSEYESVIATIRKELSSQLVDIESVKEALRASKELAGELKLQRDNEAALRCNAENASSEIALRFNEIKRNYEQLMESTKSERKEFEGRCKTLEDQSVEAEQRIDTLQVELKEKEFGMLQESKRAQDELASLSLQHTLVVTELKELSQKFEVVYVERDGFSRNCAELQIELRALFEQLEEVKAVNVDLEERIRVDEERNLIVISKLQLSNEENIKQIAHLNGIVQSRESEKEQLEQEHDRAMNDLIEKVQLVESHSVAVNGLLREQEIQCGVIGQERDVLKEEVVRLTRESNRLTEQLNQAASSFEELKIAHINEIEELQSGFDGKLVESENRLKKECADALESAGAIRARLEEQIEQLRELNSKSATQQARDFQELQMKSANVENALQAKSEELLAVIAQNERESRNQAEAFKKILADEQAVTEKRIEAVKQDKRELEASKKNEIDEMKVNYEEKIRLREQELLSNFEDQFENQKNVFEAEKGKAVNIIEDQRKKLEIQNQELQTRICAVESEKDHCVEVIKKMEEDAMVLIKLAEESERTFAEFKISSKQASQEAADKQANEMTIILEKHSEEIAAVLKSLEISEQNSQAQLETIKQSQEESVGLKQSLKEVEGEVELLKVKITELESQLQVKESSVHAKATRINEMEFELKESKRVINEQTIRLNEVESELNSNGMTVNENITRISRLQVELSESLKNVADNHEKISEQENELNTKAATIREYISRVSELEGQLSVNAVTYREQTDRVSELEIEIVQLAKSIEDKVHQMHELEGTLVTKTSDLKERDARIADLQEQVLSLSEQSQNQAERITSLGVEKVALEESIERLKSEFIVQFASEREKHLDTVKDIEEESANALRVMQVSLAELEEQKKSAQNSVQEWKEKFELVSSGKVSSEISQHYESILESTQTAAAKKCEDMTKEIKRLSSLVDNLNLTVQELVDEQKTAALELSNARADLKQQHEQFTQVKTKESNDHAEALAALNQALAKAQTALKQEEDNHAMELSKAGEELLRLNKEVAKYVSQIAENQQALEDGKLTMENMGVQHAIKLREAEESVRDSNGKWQDKFDKAIAEAVAERKIKEEKVAELETECEQIRSEHQAVSFEVDRLEAMIAKMETTHSTQVNQLKAELNAKTIVVQQQNQLLQQLEAQVKAAAAAAETGDAKKIEEGNEGEDEEKVKRTKKKKQGEEQQEGENELSSEVARLKQELEGLREKHEKEVQDLTRKDKRNQEYLQINDAQIKQLQEKLKLAQSSSASASASAIPSSTELSTSQQASVSQQQQPNVSVAAGALTSLSALQEVENRLEKALHSNDVYLAKIEKLHAEKMNSEESNVNLNRYVNELKDTRATIERRAHELEKENMVLVQKVNEAETKNASLAKSLADMDEKVFMMQVQSRDREEYDDQVLASNRRIETIKDMLINLENDFHVVLAEQPVFAKLQFEMYTVARELTVENFIERLTGNLIKLLLQFEEVLRDQDQQIYALNNDLQQNLNSFYEKEFKDFDQQDDKEKDIALDLSMIADSAALSNRNKQDKSFISDDDDIRQLPVDFLKNKYPLESSSSLHVAKSQTAHPQSQSQHASVVSYQQPNSQNQSQIPQQEKEQYDQKITFLNQKVRNMTRQLENANIENEEIKRNLSSFYSLTKNNQTNTSQMKQENDAQKLELEQLKEEIEEHEMAEEKNLRIIRDLKNKIQELERKLVEDAASHKMQVVRDNFIAFFKLGLDKSQKTMNVAAAEQYLTVLLNLLGVADAQKKEFIAIFQAISEKPKKFKLF